MLPASSSLSSLSNSLTLLLLICTLLLTSPSNALKYPFHPRDILPVLPRQVSWPILNALNGAADLLPAFVGSASDQNGSVEWKGACFYKNQAWMEFHNKSGSEFGGGTLHIKVLFFIIKHLFHIIAFMLIWELLRCWVPFSFLFSFVFFWSLLLNLSCFAIDILF